MATPGSIIDALGGTKQVAEALQLSKSTVSGWRERSGGIPAPHWATLVRLAGERERSDITLEVLAEMAARQPEGARA
jgi:transcriptional regulator with XRE-family HTH domain